MEDFQFNQINTRIRTYETKLINEAQWERMLQAKSPNDVYSILSETGYGAYIDELSDVYQFEGVLESELSRVYQLMYEMTPVKEIVDFYALKYDYHNLKVLVKAKSTGEDFSDLLHPVGSVSLQELKNAVSSKESTVLEVPMIECIQDVFSVIDDYRDLQSIDIIFDDHYWKHMYSLGEKLENTALNSMIGHMVNIYNISATLRCYLMGKSQGFISAVLSDYGTLPKEGLLQAIKQSLEAFVDYLQGTPYKELINESYHELIETRTLSHFDLLKDNYIMKALKERKIVPFGPSTMMGYIFAKEIEIKNIRLLLISKINRVNETIIRDRMRDTYV